MSEITVVIPNYNGMKYLAECMTSLCREQQNAPGYEVLIIDNASVDGSGGENGLDGAKRSQSHRNRQDLKTNQH